MSPHTVCKPEKLYNAIKLFDLIENVRGDFFMQILILLLIFFIFGRLVPLLLPMFTIVTIIILGLNLRRMFSQSNVKRFNQENRTRNIFDQQDDNAPSDSNYEKEEFTDPLRNKPASVRDEKFWEQDHTVYDVPFEEAPPVDEDEESDDSN